MKLECIWCIAMVTKDKTVALDSLYQKGLSTILEEHLSH